MTTNDYSLPLPDWGQITVRREDTERAAADARAAWESLRRTVLTTTPLFDTPEPNRDNVDVPLLRKCVEWAEAEAEKPEHEREWVQRSWHVPAADHRDYWRAKGELSEERLEHCGTAYCFGGYACHVSGLSWTADGGVLDDDRSVEEAATALLGLDRMDARDLFNSHNDIKAVREIAENIAGEPL